ncbi:Phospholipase B-like [Meloidogyne graminicola]|uniref:Phospholipase B-like n=1 Tax=Meloidogyne graminicola TaxID=189291 RepID=A0A8S9ZS67_9BILA|nr:Phospholipase B-like [Meloidogyne graminicola]
MDIGLHIIFHFLKKYLIWVDLLKKQILIIGGVGVILLEQKIFHRDHNKVKDMKTLKELMRYNNYKKNDEFSRCKCQPPYTADGGISTRSDLNPLNGNWELPDMGFKNEGTIDYKGTNYKLFKQFRFEVIGGPIYGGSSNIPPFNWENTTINNVLHYGQPIIWKFNNFTIKWKTKLDNII